MRCCWSAGRELTWRGACNPRHPMKPVILFLCSLIAACAPKMVSHPVIAPPPPKSAAITPVADTVRKNFSANAVVAAKLEGQE